MMELDLPPEQRRKLRALGAKAKVAYERGVRQGLYFTGRFARKFIWDEMAKPKSGRLSMITIGKGRRARRVLHRSSAPGEYPAIRTGRLKRSVNFQVRGSDTLALGANTPYAPFLEERMNRAFLKPTLVNNNAKIRRIIATRVKWAIEQEFPP